jgi:hypothetical protein
MKSQQRVLVPKAGKPDTYTDFATAVLHGYLPLSRCSQHLSLVDNRLLTDLLRIAGRDNSGARI